MLSNKPIWRHYHFRSWRIAALDVALAVAVTGYAALAWHWRAEWPEDVFFSLGIIAGIVLIRARDTVVRRWGASG